MRLRDRLTEPVVVDWLPVGLIPPVLILDGGVTSPPLTALGVASAFVACLPLVLRRRLPFLQLAPILVVGIVFAVAALDCGNTVVLIPMTALLSGAARQTRRGSVAMAVAVVPCVLVSIAPFADSSAEYLSLVARNVALCLLAVAAGDAVRSRREAAERAHAAMEQEALRRVDEERLRLAREVHDVVAHAMVAINVQAGVAAHLLDQDAGQAKAALLEIKATSGDALADLRATLGTLRAPGTSAPVAPGGTLEDLADLTAGLRAAGVHVAVQTEPLASVPPAVHAAGYRIAQEALTNVLRHAGAVSVSVTVHRGNGHVVLDVVDDGRAGGPPDRSGTRSGLRGMQERAAALGGAVEAGPRPGGGWRVHATLPVGG